MNKTGKVVRWEADRGFGFISGEGETQDVFFHVRDYRGGGTPIVGQKVSYELIHVGGKGPRAMAVAPLGHAAMPSGPVDGRPRTARGTPSDAARRLPRRSAPRGLPRDPWLKPVLLAAFAWLLLLAWASGTHRLPAWAVPGWLALNAWTFLAYWRDKRAAQRGAWRTPENTLHFWSLLGGWPGARVAQQVLRHKSSKASFQSAYWLTTVAHVLAVGAWLHPDLVMRLLHAV